MTHHSELRPWTLDKKTETGRTIRVKRCCESCGQPVGDATADEMEAAIAGRLPDIADECGCGEIVMQLAMFNQAADAKDHGIIRDGVAHPAWDETFAAGQREYVAEALRTVRALGRLGWGPLERVLKQIGDPS